MIDIETKNANATALTIEAAKNIILLAAANRLTGVCVCVPQQQLPFLRVARRTTFFFLMYVCCSPIVLVFVFVFFVFFVTRQGTRHSQFSKLAGAVGCAMGRYTHVAFICRAAFTFCVLGTMTKLLSTARATIDRPLCRGSRFNSLRQNQCMSHLVKCRSTWSNGAVALLIVFL